MVSGACHMLKLGCCKKARVKLIIRVENNTLLLPLNL